ncbi:MAG: queuosine salvage family protein [Pseudomonadota bacterium]
MSLSQKSLVAEDAAISLVEQVLPCCAWVSQQARHVKIHPEKIPAYAEFILGRYRLVTEMDSSLHHVSGDPAETAAYFLALDSVNFGSGYFPFAEDYGIRLDYAVVAGSLKKAFERGELRKPEQWVKATPEDFSRMLHVPMGAHPKLDELLSLFAGHLRKTGEKILSGYGGEPLRLLEAADYSAAKLADIVAEWDSFRGVHTYKGRKIPCLKRAQILAADLNLALSGFADMDKLTTFADNLVPHVLRCDGILEYDAELTSKIDNGVLLPSGSGEEIEIRAAAVHAVELMRQAARDQGHAVTSVNLDHLLWHRGHEPALRAKPTHRTLSADY